MFTRFGTPDPGPLVSTAPERLRALDLPEGSMRPKAEAAAAFVERTGGLAAIGPLDDALGTTGTTVRAAQEGGAIGPTASAAARPADDGASWRPAV
ncbi:hypothetical protein [Kitasatospora purpeofusca]|uniref:hypothetical protein n=1 Tax=Kitasatospora purpeofusca TaxID=67352 RepID=UPI002E152354